MYPVPVSMPIPSTLFALTLIPYGLAHTLSILTFSASILNDPLIDSIWMYLEVNKECACSVAITLRIFTKCPADTINLLEKATLADENE
jgi:hypothetical protein